MRYSTGLILLAGLFIVSPQPTYAQSGVIKFDYQDPSQRKTRRTEREDRQKKEAEEAKKKAEEAKRNKEREERMKRWQDERAKRDDGKSKQGGTTTASGHPAQGSGKPGAPQTAKGANSAAMPKTAGGNTDPTTREVTEVMLDAIKTQHVNFDLKEARDNPSVILLNPPQTDPSQRRRAAEGSIAQPL